MGAHICPMPIVMRPAERIARINHVVETILKRQKEEDRQWEDKVDVSKISKMSVPTPYLMTRPIRILIRSGVTHIQPDASSIYRHR